ncbi:hypothetical protein [Fructilactobacillus sanfranciscensis]
MFLGILSVLPLLVTQIFNVSMPGYISHILHVSSVSYGITDMFYGIGGLVAGLITAKLLEKMTKKNLLIDFFLIASLALLALFIHNWREYPHFDKWGMNCLLKAR